MIQEGVSNPIASVPLFCWINFMFQIKLFLWICFLWCSALLLPIFSSSVCSTPLLLSLISQVNKSHLTAQLAEQVCAVPFHSLRDCLMWWVWRALDRLVSVFRWMQAFQLALILTLIHILIKNLGIQCPLNCSRLLLKDPSLPCPSRRLKSKHLPGPCLFLFSKGETVVKYSSLFHGSYKWCGSPPETSGKSSQEENRILVDTENTCSVTVILFDFWLNCKPSVAGSIWHVLGIPRSSK